MPLHPADPLLFADAHTHTQLVDATATDTHLGMKTATQTDTQPDTQTATKTGKKIYTQTNALADTKTDTQTDTPPMGAGDAEHRETDKKLKQQKIEHLMGMKRLDALLKDLSHHTRSRCSAAESLRDTHLAGEIYIHMRETHIDTYIHMSESHIYQSETHIHSTRSRLFAEEALRDVMEAYMRRWGIYYLK